LPDTKNGGITTGLNLQSIFLTAYLRGSGIWSSINSVLQHAVIHLLSLFRLYGLPTTENCHPGKEISIMTSTPS